MSKTRKPDKDHGNGVDGDIYRKDGRLKGGFYQRELQRLQNELVNLQYWIKDHDLRVVLVFEGRGGAGKGGAIKRITEPLNPRGCRVVALAKPSDRERSQWYFQRYISHLPSAGEIVIFDRSWYNRSGVEKVMGFCSDKQYREFLRSCPEFERMLVRDGTILLKYWFSVSAEEQEKRFQARVNEPRKRWKLSDIDLAERDRWVDFSRAKDETFFYTDIEEAPWRVVLSDEKKKARLNCIRDILKAIPHKDITLPEVTLPPRADGEPYQRPPREEQHFVPEVY